MSSPKVLGNCSMLQLHLSFVSTSPICNPSSSPSLKGEKPSWMEEKTVEWESFPTPLATSKRLFKHPKMFLYHAK